MGPTYPLLAAPPLAPDCAFKVLVGEKLSWSTDATQTTKKSFYARRGNISPSDIFLSLSAFGGCPMHWTDKNNQPQLVAAAIAALDSLEGCRGGSNTTDHQTFEQKKQGFLQQGVYWHKRLFENAKKNMLHSLTCAAILLWWQRTS